MSEHVIAKRDEDHGPGEGRAPVLRTHYLYEVRELRSDPRCQGKRSDGFKVVERSWYVTTDGTSRTHLDEARARDFVLSEGTEFVDKRACDLLRTIDERTHGTWPVGVDSRGRAVGRTFRLDASGRPVRERFRSLVGGDRWWISHRKCRCVHLLGAAHTSSRSPRFEVQQLGTDGSVLWAVGSTDRDAALLAVGVMSEDGGSRNARGREVGGYVLVED